jgi:hypothetical protein
LSHAYGSKPFRRAVPRREYIVAAARAPRGEPAKVQFALLPKCFSKRAYRQFVVIEGSTRELPMVNAEVLHSLDFGIDVDGSSEAL